MMGAFVAGSRLRMDLENERNVWIATFWLDVGSVVGDGLVQ